jgi:hypothetical protein
MDVGTDRRSAGLRPNLTDEVNFPLIISSRRRLP